MADKKQRIDVTVELEDELSRPARTAGASVDELGDEVDELSASAAAATVSTGRLERALNAVRRASGSATREIDGSDKAAKRWSASARTAKKDTDGLGKSSKKSGELMAGLGKVMKLIKFPAIAAAITLAATAVSSLGAAAFAAVAGLAPLVGVLGTVPALLLAVITAAAATKMGFKGVGEALKVVTDNTKSSAEQMEALTGLTREGQVFVGVLEGVVRETRGWSRAIQSAMLPGFTQALKDMSPILPVVETGLRRAGKAMGDLALAASGELNKGDIRDILGTSNRILRTGLTPAMVAFTSIFQDFAVAGGPQAERFATYMGLAAEHVSAMVDRGRQTGELGAFLERAGDLAADLGAVIGDVATGLFNVGQQAQGLAGSMGSGIATMISDWRDWTDSLEGKNAIAGWFSDAAPLMSALGDTVGILADSFMQLAANGDLAGLVHQINDELLPAMSNFANGAAMNLGPALVSLATAFIDFQAALSWSPLATILQGVALAAGTVLDVFNLLPGPMKMVIASLIILRTTSKLAGLAFGTLRTQGNGQAGAFAQMRAGVQLYTEGLRGVPKAVGAAKGAMAGLASAGKGMLGALGGPWGIALAAGTMALGFWAKKQAEAKAKVDNLKSSLDAQTGALTADSRALVANSLESEGVYKNAEKLGLSLGVVTDAAMGNKDAIDQVAVAYANAEGKYQYDADGYKTLTAEGMAWNDLNDAVTDETTAVGKAVAAGRRTAEGMKTTTAVTLTATEALRQKVAADRAAAAGSDRVKGAYRQQGGALQYVITKTKELRNLQLEAIGAEISYQQAKDDTVKALREGKRSLDINTQAGRDNVTSIKGLVEAAAGLKNEAKRTAALKEAAGMIRKWGDESNISKDRINGLIDRMIKTKEVATALDGTSVVVGVDADVSRAYSALAAFRSQASAILAGNGASLADMDANLGGPVRERRQGGPVMAGETYRMGEVGPEYLLSASGVTVVGQFGQEQRRVDEPGWVLPNEYYEAANALPEATAPADNRQPAMSGGGDGPLPKIEQHFHGATLTPAEVEAATIRAWRKYDRERRERRQGGGG